jgi:hypothetical protein
MFAAHWRKAMSNKEEARRSRADELRRRIAERNSLPDSEATEDHPEMLPGESPNEYIERRTRELKKKKAGTGPHHPSD